VENAIALADSHLYAAKTGGNPSTRPLTRVTSSTDSVDERSSLVFSRLKEAVLVEDSRRMVKFANQAFVDTFTPGLQPEMLKGGDCDQAAVASAAQFVEGEAWLARTREIVELGENVSDEEWQLKDGRWLARDYAVRESSGKVFEHMWIYRDATAVHENQERTISQVEFAGESPYIGAPKRVITRIESLSNGGQAHVTAALIKLSAIDRVNSELGFQFGDDLIGGVLADLESVFGEQHVMRLRGATFALWNTALNAPAVLKKIEELLLPTRRLDEQVIMLRYGVGLAESGISGDPCDCTLLLNAAQSALRIALASGRNTIATHDMLVKDKALMELDLGLPEALEQNQLHMVFQPQRNLSAGAPLGFEAYVRWNHPVRGTLPAAEFIPLAEEIGLIPQIDHWVIRNVIPVVNRLLTWGGDHVAINLSAKTLEDDETLVSLLTSICEAEGVDPAHVEIEVTETAIARAPEVMNDRLRKLRSLGFRVAIDDFGVGQSSLANLRDIPFDTLKLDKSFIKNIDHPRTSELIQAAAEMARIFVAMILAEGVETSQQVDLLIKSGVNAGQGWHLGMPEPLSHYEN
jgi:EAL domain-containing protein (putative c-di-GMP-specific phosphodiesterase class I)/GGDEF domain-containing protein